MIAVAMAAALALTPAQSSQIDRIVTRVMHDEAIPGCSVGASRGTATLLLRGYGNAAADAIYPIGSITKQFTAAVVLQTIASGRLTFDAQTHGVTVEELLNQTSGVPNYSPDERSLDAALRSPPAFTPGTQWAYSNTNYVLLASTLQNATKTPFAQLVQKDIVGPLHLTHTSAVDDHGDIGMTSTVGDLLTWLHALDSGRVVSTQQFERMSTSGHLADGSPTGYGYGFFIRDWYGWKAIEHPGYVDGNSADDALLPGDDLAIAALCNRGPVSLEPLLKSIAAIVEPARDTTLVATIGASAQNEDANVRRKAEEIVANLGLGEPESLEFISRSAEGDETQEHYRVTFDAARYRLTLTYRHGTFVDASIGPDAAE